MDHDPRQRGRLIRSQKGLESHPSRFLKVPTGDATEKDIKRTVHSETFDTCVYPINTHIV